MVSFKCLSIIIFPLLSFSAWVVTKNVGKQIQVKGMKDLRSCARNFQAVQKVKPDFFRNLFHSCL